MKLMVLEQSAVVTFVVFIVVVAVEEVVTKLDV